MRTHGKKTQVTSQGLQSSTLDWRGDSKLDWRAWPNQAPEAGELILVVVIEG